MRAAFFLPLLCALAAPAAHAQMYKCVDERGVVTYADSPRPGCKGKEVDIRGQPPISGELQAPKTDLGREEAEFRRRRLDRDEAEAKEATALAARQRECDRMRSEVSRLQYARRVITNIGPNGERTYLDDDARQKRLADLQGKLAACP